MTIQETFDSFILSRRMVALSDKTIKDYTEFIKPFIKFVGEHIAIEDIRQNDITSYITNLLNRPLSKASFATYVRHLKIFLKWSISEYTVFYSVNSIKVPKAHKKCVRVYSGDEIRCIFSNIQSSVDWIKIRNCAIVALMLDSGLRQGEICSLLFKNINKNRMTVCGKGDKERVVPLGTLASAYLKRYLEECPHKSKYVFVSLSGDSLSCNAVKLMITKLAKNLDFELSSHKLRHNFATNYCLDQYREHGQIDIYRLMYLLGHEDIKTTRRYLHFAYEIIASEGCISHIDMIYDVKKEEI